MQRWSLGWLIGVAVFVVGVPTAFAQGGGASTTGTIQGRVTDASGGVLPGATVTISYATGTSFEAPSNILAPRTARIGFRFEW